MANGRVWARWVCMGYMSVQGVGEELRAHWQTKYTAQHAHTRTHTHIHLRTYTQTHTTHPTPGKERGLA